MMGMAHEESSGSKEFTFVKAMELLRATAPVPSVGVFR